MQGLKSKKALKHWCSTVGRIAFYSIKLGANMGLISSNMCLFSSIYCVRSLGPLKSLKIQSTKINSFFARPQMIAPHRNGRICFQNPTT